ncbi:uncharacterized protein J3D65DRAFT_603619 [Phyllosticta citribraziliensis]|uniref:Uncharacterized protein n=1 Tax=Phyllosticta citribraziliensis TaxID=989973 RepID=A0ABR1LKS2_9PEZI
MEPASRGRSDAADHNDLPRRSLNAQAQRDASLTSSARPQVDPNLTVLQAMISDFEQRMTARLLALESRVHKRLDAIEDWQAAIVSSLDERFRTQGVADMEASKAYQYSLSAQYLDLAIEHDRPGRSIENHVQQCRTEKSSALPAISQNMEGLNKSAGRTKTSSGAQQAINARRPVTPAPLKSPATQPEVPLQPSQVPIQALLSTRTPGSIQSRQLQKSASTATQNSQEELPQRLPQDESSTTSIASRKRNTREDNSVQQDLHQNHQPPAAISQGKPDLKRRRLGK